ncbi:MULTISPECIES: hypothetical protein [Achromobacter]|uniref:hypothetical protein n=1 Tax=Achromobacter TaxID=222 RepID=UPI0025C12A5E|nr:MULTISPECIES: hypothetical protein [Achromobacter]
MMKKTNKEKFRRAKIALLKRDRHQSLAQILSTDRDAFSGIRLLFASDSTGAPIQKALEQAACVNSLFCGKGMLAFSEEIHAQMSLGRADLQFGVRAILDTNLFSDLPKFFTGDEISTRRSVEMALRFVQTTLGGHIDWTFASLENLREVTKANNPWPFVKVAAAHHFAKRGLSSVDEAGLLKYIPAAEDQWLAWLASGDCWRQITRRDVCYAVTLFSILECWKGRAVNDAMSNLVEFCLDSFDTLPLKEIYFGWKAIMGIHEPVGRLAVFGERAISHPTKDSLKRISALAWDLFIFRWCETLMTELKGSKFYIPAVTTLDSALLETIKACPLRAVLIDDVSEVVEAIFDDELDFQQCLSHSISEATQIRINDPERNPSVDQISRYGLAQTIYSLEAEVADRVKAAQKSGKTF